MRSQTTITSVIDYLVEQFTILFPDVHVTDGQPIPPKDQEPDLLCVGFTGEIGEPSVENSRNRQQAKTYPDRETYELTCLSSSWKGNDTDPKVVRDRAFEILNEVASFIYKDHTLGQRVMRARVLTDLLAQEQTTQGAVATIRFVVQFDAFTR